MRRPITVAAIAAALFTIALCAAPGAGAWSWPLAGPVVQPFRFDPEHPYAAGQHRGVDIAGDAGSQVRAPVPGTVTYAGTVPASGTTLAIATSDGYSVTLTHLGPLAVARGAVVAEGDVVASAGSSGDAEVEGTYVHLGVRLAAAEQGYIDPLTLLPARSAPPPGGGAAVPAAPPVTTAVATPMAPAPPPAPAVPAPPAQVAEPSVAPAATAPDGATEATTAPATSETPAAAAPPAGATLVVSRAAAATVTKMRQQAARPGSPVRARRPSTAARPYAIPSPRHVRPRRMHVVTRPAHVVRRDAEPRAADTNRPAAAVVRQVAPGQAAGPDDVAVPVLPLAALCVALAAAALAAVARRRRAPIMERHALLRHDAHLLRQRPAAHRSLVHDHRGRHPRAPSSSARRGDVLPHRRRRARDQGVACR